SPSNLYQEFTNICTYYKQVTLCNSTLNKQKLLNEARTVWKEIKKENETAIRQKNAITKIKEATQRISECEQAIKLISDQKTKKKLSTKIEKNRIVIKGKKTKTTQR
ncbi:549_t:CDS:2, partial [Racocetra fulgida]